MEPPMNGDHFMKIHHKDTETQRDGAGFAREVEEVWNRR